MSRWGAGYWRYRRGYLVKPSTRRGKTEQNVVKLSRFEVKLIKKKFFKFFLKKNFFYSVKRHFFLKKIAQKTAHFDGRWYFCLRA